MAPITNFLCWYAEKYFCKLGKRGVAYQPCFYNLKRILQSAQIWILHYNMKSVRGSYKFYYSILNMRSIVYLNLNPCSVDYILWFILWTPLFSIDSRQVKELLLKVENINSAEQPQTYDLFINRSFTLENTIDLACYLTLSDMGGGGHHVPGPI